MVLGCSMGRAVRPAVSNGSYCAFLGIALLLCSISVQSSLQHESPISTDSIGDPDPESIRNLGSHRTNHHHDHHSGSQTGPGKIQQGSSSLSQARRLQSGSSSSEDMLELNRESLFISRNEMEKTQGIGHRPYLKAQVDLRTGARHPHHERQTTGYTLRNKAARPFAGYPEENKGQNGYIAAGRRVTNIRPMLPHSRAQHLLVNEKGLAQIPKPSNTTYQVLSNQAKTSPAPYPIQLARKSPRVQTKIMSASITHGIPLEEYDSHESRVGHKDQEVKPSTSQYKQQVHNKTELPQKDAIPIFGPPIIGKKPEASSHTLEKNHQKGRIDNNVISNSILENIAKTDVTIKSTTEVTEPGLTPKEKKNINIINQTSQETVEVTEPGLTAGEKSSIPVTEANKKALDSKKTSQKTATDNKTEMKGRQRKESRKKIDSDSIENNIIRACPYPCICQERKVFCDKLMLTRVPEGVPPDTINLNIKENYIKRIQYRRLKGLGQLKHLLAKGNRIHSVQPKALRDLHQLHSLSFTENRIRRLSPQVFSNLYSLQYLSLRMNKITKIEGLFVNNRLLKLLNLGSNRIKKITDQTFKSNTILRVLDLHNNSITSLHKDAFTWMPYLKFLVLRDNPLKSAEFNFKFNFHLELLDFTNCRLQEVMKGLPYSIRDLRLSENSIKELKPEDFKNTKRIRLLVLNKNKISTIRDDTFRNLTFLYDVYLSHNRLKKLPSYLPDSVHALYINNNNLTSVGSTAFENSTKMEILMLKWNQIKDIAKNAFKGLSILRSLDISNNEITDIKSGTLSNLHGLEILDLSSNPIERLSHDCFSGLENLNILQMASVDSQSDDKHLPASVFKALHNLLFLDLSNSTSIVRHLAENPYVLSYLRSLEDINLMDSAIYSLPQDFPSHFPYLKVVKLVGNPWHCDRSIFWLTTWMKNRDVNFFSRHNMVCASPPKMKGKRIADINENDLPTIAPPARYKPKVKPIDIPFKHVTRKNVTVELKITEKQMGQYAANNPHLILTKDSYATAPNEQAVETTHTDELSTFPNIPLNATQNETEYGSNFTRREIPRENGQAEGKRLKWFKSSEFRPFKKWIEPLPDKGKILNATRIDFIKASFQTQQGQPGTKVKGQDDVGSGMFSGETDPPRIT